MKNSKKISLTDIDQISKENKFWILHVTQVNPNLNLQIQPISGEPAILDPIHVFATLMDKIDIPVFEILETEVWDFIPYLDDRILQTTKIKKSVGPLIIGFNYKRLVKSTAEVCYCIDGVLDIIAAMDFEFIANLEID